MFIREIQNKQLGRPFNKRKKFCAACIAELRSVYNMRFRTASVQQSLDKYITTNFLHNIFIQSRVP